jgi:hypothetical protein
MPDLLADFGQKVLNANEPAPGYLSGPNNRPVGNRFNVYRNNVVLGLTNALADSFPVIAKLIGAKNFADLANTFVRAHPPQTPLMMFYGNEFPAYLQSIPALAHLPYLADTARLEQARRLSFHAADATPIDAKTLLDIPESSLPLAHFHLHPSMHLISSPYPVLSIWRYNATDDQSPLPAHEEDVLVARPFDLVEMRTLPAGGIGFLQALQAGNNLQTSIEIASSTAPDFDPIAQLTGLLAANLIVEIT